MTKLSNDYPSNLYGNNYYFPSIALTGLPLFNYQPNQTTILATQQYNNPIHVYQFTNSVYNCTYNNSGSLNDFQNADDQTTNSEYKSHYNYHHHYPSGDSQAQVYHNYGNTIRYLEECAERNVCANLYVNNS